MIETAYLKAGTSTDPKQAAEFKKRQALNQQKQREYEEKQRDPTGAMRLKEQLDKERREELGIKTEEEEGYEEAKSTFNSKN